MKAAWYFIILGKKPEIYRSYRVVTLVKATEPTPSRKLQLFAARPTRSSEEPIKPNTRNNMLCASRVPRSCLPASAAGIACFVFFFSGGVTTRAAYENWVNLTDEAAASVGSGV